MKKSLQALLFAAGLLLFAWSILAVNPRELKVLLPAVLGPGFLVFLFYPVMTLWDVAGWQILFPEADRPRARFRDLFAIRLCGEAMNNITPFLDVGGEPVKVLLSSRRFGILRRSAVSSVVMARTALFFSEIIFIVAGLLVSAFVIPMGTSLQWGLGGSAVLLSLFAAALALYQKKGFFLPFLRWIERANPRWIRDMEVPVQEVDRDISLFYSSRSGRLWLSIFLQGVGWVFGGIEIFFMCRVLGSPVGLIEGIALEALLQLVKSATFFIPGNLGTQEGAMAFFLQSLGFHPAAGVALSLMKRMRQLVWTAVGFGIWAQFRGHNT